MSGRVKVLLVCLSFFAISCGAIQEVSKFSSGNVKPGMDKDQVVSLYKKPYKQSFFYDDRGILHEQFFYKEQVFQGKWYEITCVLHFRDSKLESIQQLDEMPLTRENRVE